MANHYEIPNWAAKAPPGLHLDVMKGTKFVQKLMIDQKRCYLFGRNPQMCDFSIDHASCSRVHSALVWHKHLQRAFLVDLGSTHGTYIGSLRLEPNQPTQLPVDSKFHFGASTRQYILRERPQVQNRPILEELEEEEKTEHPEGGLLGLPESEMELENLTEYNTAHNRRISMLGIGDDDFNRGRKRKRISVTFNEDEQVINPEDVDPSIGRFRNLVQTTVIQTVKKPKADAPNVSQPTVKQSRPIHPTAPGLYSDVPQESLFSLSVASKLGLPLMPNPAPDIDAEPVTSMNTSYSMELMHHQEQQDDSEPKKKKYAKEAWPGRKPPHLLV
uniref:Nuclear inhibitor of protein phosphatase 1 n=1 Tax=Lynceus sp. MCZ IZ 141354 TaxID=1930659 RepID=A0A9N6WT25_9CRUS|nr:EOG090X07CE [Lynceus sp. MCZ IZ 141354]